MTLFQAFILGLVQGLTEFLPVSSSAHLILVPWIFKWTDPGLAFDVFLHLGTLAAIMIYFFRDIWDLAKGGLESILDRRIGYDKKRILFWMLVIGTIPAAVAGMLFHEQAEESLRSPLLIAVTLSFVGFLIFWIDGRYPLLRRMDEMTLKDALLIGCAQAFAIIPGVSRSGATMTMARRLGLNREAAARFSFLLCMPIIAGAGLMESRHLINDMGDGLAWSYLWTGFFSSFFFGLAAIHLLLSYLRNADLAIFFWYRLAVSIFVVAWSMIYKV
jgi:undecaprenyl-diphosphatase